MFFMALQHFHITDLTVNLKLAMILHLTNLLNFTFISDPLPLTCVIDAFPKYLENNIGQDNIYF